MTKILTIDAGTTGITALVVDDTGSVLARGYREFPQHFPQPGWVEHDAQEIWRATKEACTAALGAAGMGAADVSAIGITNQRETAVLWNRANLKPIANAIVWQDRRTAQRCTTLQPHAALIRERTGLVVDAYFSGTKVEWLLDHVDGAREAAERGELAFGTVDSWLVACLTAGRVHATEPSNASRTMLYDIRNGGWSAELCDLLRVPQSLLPELRPSAGLFGNSDADAFLGINAPITGIAGDQQAALFGQGCWTPGMSKNTYGTGSFVLLNTGSTLAKSETLLTTVAWDVGEGLVYALEGSIFVTGAAIQWLRDGIGMISEAAETGPLAESVPDTGDVYLVPAFTGLGAPWWDPYARGTIVGLTRGTSKAHIARAAMEAMAYQTRDVIEVMQADSGVALEELRVDGGASAMAVLCQFQADLLGVPVLRPQILETTAMGAAFLAGLGAGVWASTVELADAWHLDQRFTPEWDKTRADAAQARWHEALAHSRGWAKPDA